MIVIIGASGGIGKYLLETYVKEGVEVIGTYNKSIPNESLTPFLYQLDITDADLVNKFISSLNLTSNIVLINCAGLSYNSFAHKVDLLRWKEVIDVNLVGVFNVIRFILPFMRANNFGRIINFSSVVTKLPTPGVSAYAASKAALIGLTKTLAVENASKGITVNAINLGYTEAGMGINDVPEQYKIEMVSKIPKGRFCSLQEVLSTIEYLVKTDYITGSVVDINGGIV